MATRVKAFLFNNPGLSAESRDRLDKAKDHFLSKDIVGDGDFPKIERFFTLATGQSFDV